ncbi:MAG: hypothetical protein ACYDHO_02070 [Gaiellaceae bacterium]
MTSVVARFWATALALVVFFVLWAVLAARPWVSASSTPSDPRLAALQVREQKVQKQAIAAQQTLSKRWAAYRAALVRQSGNLSATQQAQLATAPAGPSVIVRVTGAQPLTHSTTSAPAARSIAPSQNVPANQGGVVAGG